MEKKILGVILFIFGAVGLFLFPRETLAQSCSSTILCCQSRQTVYTPLGCSTTCDSNPSCVPCTGLEDRCVVIGGGVACHVVGSGCAQDAACPAGTYSGSCIYNAPTPPPPSSGPTPPGGTTCESNGGSCFGVSDCGDVGRPSGTGTCPAGQLCCNPPGGGGDPPAPFGCTIQSFVRNTSSVVSYYYQTGQQMTVCMRALDADGLITRMTAVTQNASVVSYNGSVSLPSGYMAEGTYYCPGPRGTAIGPGATRLTLRVLGQRCPACGVETMCQGNSSVITVQDEPLPLPTVDLKVNGSDGPILAPSNTIVTLSWGSTNATTCTSSGSWSGTRAVSGTMNMNVGTATKTYNITCDGPGGSATDSVTVQIGVPTIAPPTPPPSIPTVDLRVDGSNGPITVASGATVNLSWSTTDAVSCTASGGWSGDQAVSGSSLRGPLTTTTTYDITCFGASGLRATDSVTVNISGAAQCTPPAPRDPPSTTCAPNASTNGTITWSWNPVAGATEYDIDILNASTSAVVLDNPFRAAANFNCGSGICSYTTSHLPGTSYRSRIVARGACSESTASLSSSVAIATCTASPPTVDVRANGLNSLSITTGLSATLSWSTTNASSCTASGAWSGSKAVTGAQSTGPITATVTYGLTCTGPGGSASDSVTITALGLPQCVTPAPRDPPVTTCSLSGNPGTITWSWDSVAGATQYDVDILNASGGVVLSFAPRPASDFGCASGGVCNLTTTHVPGVSLRSRIVAMGIACTDSAPSYSQYVQVPPCASCNISLNPSSMQALIGQTSIMAANVTLSPAGGTTITQTAFTSSNPAIVSVTSPDTTSPYTTNITAGAIGTATIHATATLANGGTCTTEPASGSSVTVISPNPWWQIIGGHVISGGAIRSPIPPTCTAPACANYLLINDLVSNRPSAAIYQSDYDFSSDPLSRGIVSNSDQWLVKTGTNPNIYTYQYFRNLSSGKPFVTLAANSNVDPAVVSQARGAGESYLWIVVNGNATIDQPLDINQKVILFVDGNLSINGKIRLTNANASERFLMVVVSGNINVSSSVFSASAADPALNGIFVANGTFSTGTNGTDDNRLVVRGTVAAGAINLQRDLNDENVNTPAELFQYSPELVTNYPPALAVRHMIWREVAP